MFRVPLIDLGAEFARDSSSIRGPKPSDVLNIGHVIRRLPKLLSSGTAFGAAWMVPFELLCYVKDAMYGSTGHSQWPHYQLQENKLLPQTTSAYTFLHAMGATGDWMASKPAIHNLNGRIACSCR